ncbi:MAG: hypothetical protein WAT72_01955 [Microgenomates group bacterium]
MVLFATIGYLPSHSENGIIMVIPEHTIDGAFLAQLKLKYL